LHVTFEQIPKSTKSTQNHIQNLVQAKMSVMTVRPLAFYEISRLDFLTNVFRQIFTQMQLSNF